MNKSDLTIPNKKKAYNLYLYELLMSDIPEDNRKFYHKTVRLVRGLITRRIFEDDLIDDCLQDVFMKVFRNKNDIKSPTYVLRWMITITQHECQSIIRRMLPNREKGNLVLEERTTAFAENLTKSVTDFFDVSCFEPLNDIQRSVIILKYWNNLKNIEIANAINISPDKVRSVLNIAHQIMFEWYKGRNK